MLYPLLFLLVLIGLLLIRNPSKPFLSGEDSTCFESFDALSTELIVNLFLTRELFSSKVTFALSSDRFGELWIWSSNLTEALLTLIWLKLFWFLRNISVGIFELKLCKIRLVLIFSVTEMTWFLPILRVLRINLCGHFLMLFRMICWCFIFCSWSLIDSRRFFDCSELTIVFSNFGLASSLSKLLLRSIPLNAPVFFWGLHYARFHFFSLDILCDKRIKSANLSCYDLFPSLNDNCLCLERLEAPPEAWLLDHWV